MIKVDNGRMTGAIREGNRRGDEAGVGGTFAYLEKSVQRYPPYKEV